MVRARRALVVGAQATLWPAPSGVGQPSGCLVLAGHRVVPRRGPGRGPGAFRATPEVVRPGVSGAGGEEEHCSRREVSHVCRSWSRTTWPLSSAGRRIVDVHQAG